jgi:hypothetical protein
MNTTYNVKHLQEKGAHLMLASLVVLALVYCGIILSLVFSVIERKQNTIASRELSSELSALEAKYANTVASISDADLTAHGFKHVDNATFAVRKDDIASYTVLYAR